MKETDMEAVLSRELQDTDSEGYGPEKDPFFYGERILVGYDEAGDVTYRCVPLSPDDFLDPQEGDYYMQGSLHHETVDDLVSIFRHHLEGRENIKVYSDLKIIWNPGGKNPAPDISVVADVRNPEKHRNVFDTAEEETGPFFVLEVVSPRYREQDVEKKPEIYRKAGVSEYIIVDPGTKSPESTELSYTVRGYRLIGSRYVKTAPDARGRIYSRTTDLWVGVSESGNRIIIYDGETDEPIPPDHERARQEKMRAEQEKMRAEQEKMRADNAEEELLRLKEKLKSLGIQADELK
jgi:Uma2 family endonuclease